MARKVFTKSALLLLFICCLLETSAPKCLGGRTNSHSIEDQTEDNFKVKAVSLGGWLVIEGWMTPHLFHGIPNKDLLDGTQVQLKSVATGKYVSAENGGGSVLIANRTTPSNWETFKLWRINKNTFNFRVFGNQFIGLQTINNEVVAEATTPGDSETFQIVWKHDIYSSRIRIRIRAPNGLFLQANKEGLVTADNAGDKDWGNDDPSVFIINVLSSINGEYQVTNGYGDKAPQVMRHHWSTYIVEDDFKFISQNGLNAVRIPVGWWIASDPSPPKPFVGGSLKALDNAFSWAKKYGIKVIIDLHAVPGSQNGNVHSATRDGSLEWGKTDDTIHQSVSAIDFLAARYSKHPSLYAVELINEPMAPHVSLDTLQKYYKLGYDAVRNHSSTAYVVMSNRLGWPTQPRELFLFASGLKKTVIDVHYYNLFADMFLNMTIQQNLDFVYNKRASDLAYLTIPEGPKIFVGEWVAEWDVKEATMHDFQNFANAQFQVYGQASFGWAYWGLKCVAKRWSMEWMINNDYIILPR